jgi:hypothetical protein
LFLTVQVTLAFFPGLPIGPVGPVGPTGKEPPVPESGTLSGEAEPL